MMGEVSLVIISRNRKVLIICPAGEDKWSLPGGPAGPGEGPRAALLRVLREQFTGPEIRDSPALVILEYFKPSTGNPQPTSIFRLEIQNLVLPNTEKISNTRWIDPLTAKGYRLSDEIIEAMDKFLETFHQPVKSY